MSKTFNFSEHFCENNPSSNSTWELFWSLEESEYGILIAIVLLLYVVVGLPWNCLVTGIIFKKKLYVQPTILLLLTLTLCDILMLCTIFPLNIANGFSSEFVLGNSDYMRCQLCQFAIIVTFFAFMSLFIVTLMSVDRFLFIYKAIYYKRLVTPVKMTIVLLVSSAVSLILSIPPLFGFGSVGYFRPLVFCVVDFAISSKFYLGLLIAVGLLLFLVLLVSNAWVVAIVYRNVKVIYKERNSLYQSNQKFKHRATITKTIRKKRHSKQLRLMRVFGCLLCGNFLSWIPLLAIIVSSLFVQFASIPHGVTVMAYLMFMSQVLIHPALESIIISDVKMPLIKLFTSIASLLCRKTVRSQVESKCFDDSEDKNKSEEGGLSCCRCNSLYIFQAALLPSQELKTCESEQAQP